MAAIQALKFSSCKNCVIGGASMKGKFMFLKYKTSNFVVCLRKSLEFELTCCMIAVVLDSLMIYRSAKNNIKVASHHYRIKKKITLHNNNKKKFTINQIFFVF